MSTATPPVESLRSGLAGLLGKTSSVVDKAVDNGLATLRYASWSANAWLDGNLFPAWEAGIQLQRGFRGSVLDAVEGKRTFADLLQETGGRIRSAVRFERLVNTLGKEAFGSARFEGETRLGRHGAFRLSYLPPKPGVEPTGLAIFHAGGVIPYGEQLYRLTPEYNLYGRFLERGVAVYAMEIDGDSSTVDYAAMTMDGLVRATQHLSDLAFEHNGGRKMVLEGYCGSGTQALVYLSAMPEDVERKFEAFAAFVSPIDGRKCTKLAESIQRTPAPLMDANYAIWQALRTAVPGDSLRVGLDLALGTVLMKTPMGYMTAGWMRDDLGKVKTAADLTPEQRRDLAGAYWISPDSARRFLVPTDMVRYTNKMFTEGIAPDGTLPWTFEGRPLSLGDVAKKTSIRVYGFFGADDPMVSERTAHVLMNVFGKRYQHVVHYNAGHVSYVLSPKQWKVGGPRSFNPNPVDLLLAPHAAATNAG